MSVPKIFLSLFYKTNLNAFRTAILTNDTNRICRILDVERAHICKELDNAGNTALLLAIQYASPLTVRVLLEQGAHPDQTNFNTFQTPLSVLAAMTFEKNECNGAKTAIEMATILLDHGAYIDKPTLYKFTDDSGTEYSIRETPLMIAVRTKNHPMATLFIERKANVNYCEKLTDNRPIHFSITNGDVVMFDLLENAGASCRSVITKGGDTLLHWFCYNKENDENMTLLRRLIEKDCDVNAENDRHRTPLMLAAKSNMINTCCFLVDHGADIDKVDYQGNRAIDLSKIGSECFKFLQKTQHGHTQSNEYIYQALWRKPILLTRQPSQQRSGSVKGPFLEKHKMKRFSSNSFDNHLADSIEPEEYYTKHKRMWEKLIQTKQKIRRNREISLPRVDDRSHSRRRHPSQSGTNDSCLTVEL